MPRQIRSPGSPEWSPDSQSIAFDGNADGHWHVDVVGADGGKPVRLTTSSAGEIRPSWSHDGKWIYYSSSRNGALQIWKMRASGGNEIQVTSRGGGVNPAESLDGAYIYHSNGDGSLWRVPTAGGDETELLRPNSTYGFAVAKNDVYLVDDQHSLKVLDVRTRSVRKIGSLPGPCAPGFAISPDERWGLFGKIDAQGSQLMLVENFR